jgi:hypothetical protein
VAAAVVRLDLHLSTVSDMRTDGGDNRVVGGRGEQEGSNSH